jgi:hypothetical protein
MPVKGNSPAIGYANKNMLGNLVQRIVVPEK